MKSIATFFLGFLIGVSVSGAYVVYRIDPLVVKASEFFQRMENIMMPIEKSIQEVRDNND